VTATWDPAQYNRFADERRQPFDDLLRLVEPCAGGKVVDLGCGTGQLTVDLHRHTGAASTVGVDSSPAMLERAAKVADPASGLRFELSDVESWDAQGLDVVFSNAALHWVDDHPALIPRLRAALAPGGQLAFQVPANGDHPSHSIAAALAREAPYLDAFGGVPPRGATDSVLPPEDYATLLDGLGAIKQHVRLQIYGHHLPSVDAVVEWVKGTNLTTVRAGLGDELWERYLAEYRRRLGEALDEPGAYFYTYKRILARARFD
jgi:trans-aconitate 2-methyltransferase